MRMRVKDVVALLSYGASWDGILEDYPYLEKEDIQACLDFAVAQSNHSVLKVSARSALSTRIGDVPQIVKTPWQLTRCSYCFLSV
jgi:hypothetical protein